MIFELPYTNFSSLCNQLESSVHMEAVSALGFLYVEGMITFQGKISYP